MWAQHRWHWWPFHPIGFAVAVGWLDQPDLVLGVDLLDTQRLDCALWWRASFSALKAIFLGLILGRWPFLACGASFT